MRQKTNKLKSAPSLIDNSPTISIKLDIADVYHPLHGCHHSSPISWGQNPLEVIYNITNYKNRQKIKKLVPESIWKALKNMAQK